jgi:hypothetical protein
MKSKIKTADSGTDLIVLFDKAAEEFGESSLFLMELTLSNISDYDELNSTFLISIRSFGQFVLKVEKEDSRSLKNNWSRVKFSEPAFTMAKNIETGKPQITLKSIKITNSVNQKVYTWNSLDRFDYKNVTQGEIFEYVNINDAFGDIFF